MQIHFIGIGGIGMSALAQYFLARGARVSGSDVARSEITDMLRKRGISIRIGHKKINIPKSADAVIYSFAVKKDNPELREAMRRGIPVKTYAEAVGELTRQFFTISVAGAHGKSTTTALVSLMLAQGRFDPTVVVGTKLREFGNTNFRAGRSRYLVLEADEYGGSFLRYSSDVAVITNIDREHLDYYKNFANVKAAFRKFLLRIKKGGVAVVNRDDKNLVLIARQVAKKRSDISWRWYSLKDRETGAVKKLLQIPGRHNVSNALGARYAAKIIGARDAAIKKVLREYRGAWRRSEYRGSFHGIRIYDDYGHHPTEIKVTLAGFKEKFRGKRIWCVFQPHQIERTRMFLNDFARVFEDAYGVGLLDIYQVAGREGLRPVKVSPPAGGETSMRMGMSKLLVKKLRKYHPRVWYLGDHKKIAGFLKTNAHRGDIAILMGAGDIWKNTQGLV
jgi:UDP-N-acetylmuramate--alanine ligase